MNQELRRKAIHLSSLWIPALYFFVDKGVMLALLLLATLIVISVELGRGHLSPLETLFQSLFGPVLRHEERAGIKKFTGATPLMLAATLTIALFAKPIAIAALGVLMISDTAAALIGKNFGRHKLGDKSWEGTLAFCITALIVMLACRIPFFPALLAALLGSATELYSKRVRLDDNFAIPLVVGIILTLVL